MSEKGLVELFKEIGNDNLEFQMLSQSFVNSKAKKGYNDVTFSTQNMSPDNVITGGGKVGIVVWVDRDILDDSNKSLFDK